jgi:hypothetical protein
MDLNAVIIEQIEWDGSNRAFQISADKENMWVAFPPEYEEKRDGPFHFLDEKYEYIFRDKQSSCKKRQMSTEKFFSIDEVFYVSITWSRIPTKNSSLTYYALYLPEFAIPIKIDVCDTLIYDKRFKKSVFKDKEKNRFVVYIDCSSKFQQFSFSLKASFCRDETNFYSSFYTDDKTVPFRSSINYWEHLVPENDKNKIHNFFSSNNQHQHQIMNTKPVVLMAFASNDDLDGVDAEASNLFKSVEQNQLVLVEKIENTDIESLTDSLINHSDNLFMFHFGGHASQKNIVLDGFVDLEALQLSRLLAPNDDHNLDIVFLNGCLTYGLVGQLTAKGVKAIIATNAKIFDNDAIKITKYFYKLFFEKNKTLKVAFETAGATISGRPTFITIVNSGETGKMPSHWSLFINSKHKDVLDWTLEDFLEKKI